MATLCFQNNFDQWETLEAATFCEDRPDGDSFWFKITTSQKQIKVKMHRREFEIFSNSIMKLSSGLLSQND
jgi:hypothetical protein